MKVSDDFHYCIIIKAWCWGAAALESS